MSDLGFFRGRHYAHWVEEVKTLKRTGELHVAENILLGLIEAVERESRAKAWGVAPWYYEQLAIIYRKQGRIEDEIRILERFAAQEHAAGVLPSKLVARLSNLYRKTSKQENRPSESP